MLPAARDRFRSRNLNNDIRKAERNFFIRNYRKRDGLEDRLEDRLNNSIPGISSLTIPVASTSSLISTNGQYNRRNGGKWPKLKL